ncbi:MAG: DMT family transporter [Cyanobacteriota bacterium]|nr:DMT family transporter [Cyanobacteriota bacterium]
MSTAPQLQLVKPLKVAVRSDSLALVSLFVALIAVSFAAIFIRFSEVEIGANATVFNRFWIFAVLFGTIRAIAAARNRLANPEPVTQPPLTLRHALLLVAVGVIATASLVLWAMSLTLTSVANSVLLNNLTPIFASVGGWLFFGQCFDGRFILGTGVALAGALALGLGDFQVADGSLGGDALALLSAVFLAVYFLLVEKLRDRFDATAILLCRCTIGSVLLFPFIIGAGEPLFPTTASGWLAVIGLGAFCEGIGQRLLANSLNHFSSSFVCLFLLLEPLCSAILAWIIFAEKLSVVDGISFAVVLGGIYIAKSSQAAVKTAGESA